MEVVDPLLYWLNDFFFFGFWSEWSSEDVIESGTAMESTWEARPYSGHAGTFRFRCEIEVVKESCH